MLRALLDTHSFLWFVTANPKLSATAERLITAGNNEILLSVASLWETAIKVSTGRLPIPEPLDFFFSEHLGQNRIGLLAIEPKHVLAVAQLPFHHRDPFDRLLITQALTEGIPLVSADSAFDSYGVERLW